MFVGEGPEGEEGGEGEEEGGFFFFFVEFGFVGLAGGMIWDGDGVVEGGIYGRFVSWMVREAYVRRSWICCC